VTAGAGLGGDLPQSVEVPEIRIADRKSPKRDEDPSRARMIGRGLPDADEDGSETISQTGDRAVPRPTELELGRDNDRELAGGIDPPIALHRGGSRERVGGVTSGE